MDNYRVSVRAMVEYVYSAGSIDNRFRSSSSMTEGTRIHQKLQKEYGESDQKEVFLQMDIPFDSFTLQLEGRCDGLLAAGSDGLLTIDEIKSTTKSLDLIEEQSHPVHWAQAKCYAWIVAEQNALEEIKVQLTYVQLPSEEKKQFAKVFSQTELKEYIEETAAAYRAFAVMKLKHEKQRQESIRQLAFPYPEYRSGQRAFAGTVYKTIMDRKNLMAEAPTGIGKTMSTLFPAIKSMGEGLSRKLFYLTAKTITRATAEEALSHLEAKGLYMNSVTMTAKDKICFKEETICQPEYCDFADGYYDRINGAMLDILSNETRIIRAVIEQYAMKHKICPFEFSIDLAYQADAVIGDYNYVFDPRVNLKRFLEEQKTKTVLLIDEAHNLVDRARAMFSASIDKSPFLKLKREYKQNHALFLPSKALNDFFIAFKKEMDGRKQLVLDHIPDELPSLMEAFTEEAEKELLRTSKEPANTELLLETYFAAQNFIRIAKLFDDHSIAYGEKNGNELTLNLFCIDPSENLRRMGKGYRAKIYFSATMSPGRYYQDMLGVEEDDFKTRVPSPFHRDQFQVWVQPLSTRYREREESIAPIVRTIGNLVEGKSGNHLVFFPSYQYLESVYEEFTLNYSHIQTIKQDTGMKEEERERFLERFQAGSKEPLVGFAVLGGIFSEGIDLRGDRLNGVAVVGVGLPQIGFERDLIKTHFAAHGKNGYDYAYVYPGMNKVLQAGGRLIRSETDTGTIILIDDRYLQAKYQGLLPEEWRDFRILNDSSILKE
ncbi:ATP-dependent DNA helicase [Falsibacillus pallidus]|uniref:ATP-dependent DNA helicase n=1 Tax=Falsibacillus pallidus TaxID=493781 RepID=UPI003D954E29